MTENIKSKLNTSTSLPSEINLEEEATETKRKYVTVKQLVNLPEFEGLFSECSIRWYVFNEKEMGFSRCLIRIKRKLLIDLDEFRDWIASHKQGGSK